MKIDWSKLAPHRPLSVADARYVERPDRAGHVLADRIRAGISPLAVTGPMGIGKSSELAAAAAALYNDFLVFLVPLDRTLNMSEVTESGLQLEIIAHIWDLVTRVSRLRFSPQLSNLLKRVSQERLIEGVDLGDLLRSALREAKRFTTQGRVILILDGLEKTPKDSAQQLIQTILSLQDEATLAFVVPTSLVTGPESHALVSQTRVFSIDPVPVWKEDEGFETGRKFLVELVLRRLELSEPSIPFVQMVSDAAFYSGGVPRVLLQIVEDAAAFARLAKRDLPTEQDFFKALFDQSDSLLRVLRDGDLAVLRDANDTTGVEVPLERRLRFLAQGLLLEYRIGGDVVVRPAPLLARRMIGIDIKP